jgi:hypothetical protein
MKPLLSPNRCPQPGVATFGLRLAKLTTNDGNLEVAGLERSLRVAAGSCGLWAPCRAGLWQGGLFLGLCLGFLVFSSIQLLAADDPKTFQVSEFTFERPPSWAWIKTASPMRAAQLQVSPVGSGEPAEVVFFYFGPSNGGGTQANVERWLGQFQEPKPQLKAKVEELNLRGHKVTFVQAEGTYLSGAPGGAKTPKPSFAMLGAILESKQGHVFVKMTGPAALTKSAIPAFRKMIEGAAK